jgi:hypothetical protein
MPPDFLEILESKIRKLEQAREEHAAVQNALAVGREDLAKDVRQALAAGRAIVRNTLRGDHVALEAWEAVRRYSRLVRPKKPEVEITTEPPIEPDSQPQAEPQPA